MIGTNRIGLVVFGAAAVAVAACSSDVTSPSFSVSDATISADVAAEAGDAAASTTDAMVASEATYGGDQPNGAAAPQSAPGGSSTTCNGPSGTGWFTCTSDTERGLTVVRAIRFWDGVNFGLKFDATTDSVNHTLSRTGTLTPSAIRTQWINRNDTLTMNVTRASGGVPGSRTWTGTGAIADSSLVADTASSRSYHFTANDTAASVKFLIPRSANPYPASGSITHSITVAVRATKGGQVFTRTETRRAMVTFNGTEFVTLTVGGLTCSLDLATHVVTNCQ